MASKAGAIRAGRAFVELFADDSKLVRGLRRASAKLKAFGSAVRNIGLKMAAVGAAAMAPLLGAAKVFASMGDNIAKMSQRTGMGVRALSELQFAASQSGTDIDSLEKSLGRMQRSIYDAGRALSTAVDGFADLGLTFKDLDGLSPEEQFLLIADRIHQIEDPTKKAAIAMTLLGRSGTALLPLFAKGAAGIKAYMKEARRLGLTMSEEDAAAAVRLTDAMDKLWKVVKMGVFRVGAALAPVLERLGEKIADITVTINNWIRRNGGLIVSIFKIAGAVLAGGIALVVLGAAISGLGTAIGILATAIAGVSAALGAILSPIGLVIGAVALLGGYILWASGAGGKALDWLGEKFGDLASDAKAACKGIADAMAAGDIGLAAKILWLTLKMEWAKGAEGLRNTWADFLFGLRAAHELAVHGMTVVWIEAMALWEKAMAHTEGFFADTWTMMKMMAKEAAADARGASEAEIQKIRASFLPELEATEAKKRERLTEAEDLRKRMRKMAKDEHKQNLVDIATENAAKKKAIQDEMDAAKDAWQKALDDAAFNRAMAELGKPIPGDEGPPPGPPPKFEDVLKGLPGILDRLTVRGTFNPAAILSMQTGGAANRIATATEATAKATEETAKNTRKLAGNSGKLTFV